MGQARHLDADPREREEIDQQENGPAASVRRSGVSGVASNIASSIALGQ